MAKKKRAVAADVATEEKKVLYPKKESRTYMEGGDKPPIDAETAKEILGWKEEGKGGSNVKYGEDYLLSYKDKEGKSVKVRCTHNTTNRELRLGQVKALKQEILNGRWRFNGEPIIIGKYGSLHNGQHQLIALILATYDYEADPTRYPFWKTPPQIEKTITVGIEETDEVVNTIDTSTGRTLTDALFRCEYLTERFKNRKDRGKASRFLAAAVQLLWDRTGVNLSGGIMRNLSELYAFLEAHPKVIEAVEFVMEEESEERKLSSLTVPSTSPGYYAALLFLMGCAASDPSEYTVNPNSSSLDWSLWDKACEFIVLLAGKDKSFKALYDAFKQLVEDEDSSKAARLALIVKAWGLFQAGKKITPTGIALAYETSEDGFAYLAECPIIGGIDIGKPDLVDETVITTVDPDEEEIKAKAKELRKEEEPKKEKKKAVKKAPVNQLVGKARYFTVEGETFRGRVMDVMGKKALLKILTGFQGAGNEVEVPVSDLTEKQSLPKEGGEEADAA